MELLTRITLLIIFIIAIIRSFNIPIPRDLKAYYKFTYFALENSGKTNTKMKSRIKNYYHKTFTSTTLFLKRIATFLFIFFIIIYCILRRFYFNQKIDGYMFYVVLTIIMLLIWFISISFASLKVTKMVGKLLKSGVMILSAIWASIYAFLYIQTPKFLASISGISADKILEKMSSTTSNTLVALSLEINILEVLKAFIPIIVLPFLLIMFITEATHYTKSYWIEHYNGNRDIDYITIQTDTTEG